MGMYDLMFPDPHRNERGAFLCGGILNLNQEKIGRFRDAWVEAHDDHPYIRVYTRLGGDNREVYPHAIQGLQEHPYYVRDADDSYDSTYASFWFRVPDEAPPWITETLPADQREAFTPERWKLEIIDWMLDDVQVGEKDMGEVWKVATKALEADG